MSSIQGRLTAEENAKLLPWERCGHDISCRHYYNRDALSLTVSSCHSLESIKGPSLGHMGLLPAYSAGPILCPIHPSTSGTQWGFPLKYEIVPVSRPKSTNVH